MKWGLQHVKVTLEEEDSGETVVIEQNADGRVTCERANGRRERAANSAPKAKVEVKVKAPAEPKPEAPKTKPEKTETPTPKPARPKKASTQRKAEPKSASKRLEWRPIRDYTFDGFGAESGPGMYKALQTRERQWALFYEVKGLGAKKIACFTELRAAQERARELHAKGPSEFAPLSASRIEEACPVPQPTAKPAESTTAPPVAETPAPEPEPKSPTPAPPKANAAHGEHDKELLGSFSAELDAVLDEDEDD